MLPLNLNTELGLGMEWNIFMLLFCYFYLCKGSKNTYSFVKKSSTIITSNCGVVLVYTNMVWYISNIILIQIKWAEGYSFVQICVHVFKSCQMKIL